MRAELPRREIHFTLHLDDRLTREGAAALDQFLGIGVRDRPVGRARERATGHHLLGGINMIFVVLMTITENLRTDRLLRLL